MKKHCVCCAGKHQAVLSVCIKVKSRESRHAPTPGRYVEYQTLVVLSGEEMIMERHLPKWTSHI